MAMIRARKRKDGTVSYQAVVRITGQPEARRTFTDKKKAQIWADVTTAAARESATRLPETTKFRRMTLKEAIRSWTNSLTFPKSNRNQIPAVLRLVGDISLGHLSREYVEAYVEKVRKTNTQRGRPYADASIRRQMGIIRSAVVHAATLHRVKFDTSFFNIKDIEGDWDVSRDRILSEEEELQLHAVMKKRNFHESWQSLVDLAIETAAREQELVFAELKEVNFETRVWTIPKEHTKNRYAREVPLSRKAYGIMTKLKERLDAHNAALPSGNPKRQDRLFFQFASPSSVCTGFADVVRNAGIIDFHFHDLRHTAITRMLLTKRDLEVHDIMRLAGHRSMAMFLRYANVRGKDVVKRME